MRLLGYNLALMFRAPIDLPWPSLGALWLRLMFGRRDRRGIYGLFLTAVDPGMASLTLARLGVELIEDPMRWTERYWGEDRSTQGDLAS